MAAAMRQSLTSLRKRVFAQTICQLSTATNEAVSDEVVQYPAIKPKLPPGKWNSSYPREWCWYLHRQGQKLLEIPNVKERLEHIAGSNKIWMFQAQPFVARPKVLNVSQYITKTHIARGLPDVYDTINVDSEHTFLKPLVIDAILQEHTFHHKKNDNSIDESQRERQLAHQLLGRIVGVLLSGLSANHDYLRRSQLDEDVRVESFWDRTGFKGEEFFFKGKKYGVVRLQHTDKVDYQLRSELPLPEFISPESDICQKGVYPNTPYSPKSAWIGQIYERPITMSGHWVGDPCEFSQTSVHVLPVEFDDYLQLYQHHDENLVQEAVLQYGMLAAFGSCLAQAHNQGFNYLFDVTYPYTTQAVVTHRGNWLRFVCYQLNTLQLWLDDEVQPLRNVCWASDAVKLFDAVEGDQVKGFNDEALHQLLKFLLLKPVDRGVDLRPYLPDEEAPGNKHVYINREGEEPLPYTKIGRWQYPKYPLYF